MRSPYPAPVSCARSTRFVAARIMVCVALTISLVGCGTTREYNATQQLVMSDAVDRSISSIDFRSMSGRKVYLDTSYLRHVKGQGFVNAEYATSALRQQIVAAGCLIQDSSKDAEIIIEARIGTLGADDHRVTFGVPENDSITSAVSMIPGAPRIASIPEIAFARREAREAAAKVVAFAYDRETRAPIWQSGVNPAHATARDTWVMGIGPFQGGSIRKNTKLAGSRLRFGSKAEAGSPAPAFRRPPVDYTATTRFQQGWPIFDQGSLSGDMIGPTTVDSPEEQTLQLESLEKTSIAKEDKRSSEASPVQRVAEVPAAIKR